VLKEGKTTQLVLYKKIKGITLFGKFQIWWTVLT
jgi:hypothetical protein